MPENLLPILDEKLASSLEEPIPQGTPRHVSQTIQLPNKATSIIGMRRAGKTMFVHQLRRAQMEEGVPQVRLPYINLEDERLGGMPVTMLSALVENYYRRYPEFRRTELVTWYFDEIQLVPGWEQFVRRMLDSERVAMFVTGSSAKLLSREIATSLRGRGWTVTIYPFSFREVLLHHDHSIPSSMSFMTGATRSRIEHQFLQYLTTGGFPEVQRLDAPDRRDALKGYIDVTLFRDVVERYHVSNTTALRWLVRHLMGNAGSLFSVFKFHATLQSLGYGISRDTVTEMLEYLEDCFLIRTVWMESSSERQRMVNPRKAYPIDPGLIPLFERTDRANLGHALETAIYIELERRRASITYVKTSSDFEVDFLARYWDGRQELIQVCADIRSSKTAEREIRALQQASEMFPKATLRLLTLTRDYLPGLDIPDGIILQPAYEWLLSEE